MNTCKNTLSLTEGPITVGIVHFAIPLFLSSLIQQLYNTVDLIFVGQLLDRRATAAVGASSMLITLMLGFFGGIGVGIGILMAKACGNGDHRRMHAVLHNAAGLSLLGSLILMILGWLCSPGILKLMQTPEDIRMPAILYLRIYFICMVAVICFNSASGILRALGNSRSPMIYQLVGGIANVVGDFFFLYILRMGVAGVALATLFSQTCACLVTVRHLFHLDPTYRLNLRQICIRRDLTGEILAIGLPSGIQAMIITLSNMIIQSQINTLGVISIAAFTAYFRVETLIYNPILAFGQAVSTFVSQNIGAGNMKRSRDGVKATLKLGVIVTLIMSALVILFSETFYGFFTRDPQVIALGCRMARISFPFYFVYVFLEVFADATRGSGRAFPPMVITLINMCLIRTLILMTLMHLYSDAQHLILVFPITWILTASCHYLCYRTWTQKTIQEH